MSIIGEAIENDKLDDFEEELLEEAAEEIGAGPSSRIGDILPDLSFLLSPTGPGSVESYIDHPFNANSSKGTARIIRGLTGLMGNLDYALVDVLMGSVEVYQEGHKKAEVKDAAFIQD